MYMLSAFKNFGITFIIAAVLFGVIAYYATGLVINTGANIIDEEKENLNSIMQNTDMPDTSEPSGTTGSDTGETGEGTDNPDDKIPEGESFNFLIISTDYRPDLYDTYAPGKDLMGSTSWDDMGADETFGCLSSEYRRSNVTSIMLVRIDKEDRQFTYTYITPFARVYTASGYQTLSEVFKQSGKNKIVEYIRSFTGLDVKYTFVINAYNLDELASMVQGLSVNVSKNVYTDGKYNTFKFETIKEVQNSDGSTTTDHIPNALVVSSGSKYLDYANLYNLSTVIEHSQADLNIKEGYMVQIIEQYLSYLAGLEDDQLKMTLAKLITREAEWENIDKLFGDGKEDGEEDGETSDSDSDSETAPEEPDTDLPDTDETDPDEIDPDETEPEETKIPTSAAPSDEKPWVSVLFEPDTPILETSDYSMNDFDAIMELLQAIKYFEGVKVSYPFIYRAATEDSEEYFEPNLTKGIELFTQYRMDLVPTVADEQAE